MPNDDMRNEGEAESAQPILFVSRSAPPSTSGSSQILMSLLKTDEEKVLIPVGEGSLLSRAGGDSVLRIRTHLSLMGRGARFLAPIRELLKPFVVARLVLVSRAHNVRRLICVFPDALYCSAALRAARIAGKPIDFWFHNTYAENRSGLAGVVAKRLEAKLIESGGRIFFISDALANRFIAKYPAFRHKFRVLRHPVSTSSNRPIEPRGFSSRPVKALMMGNLNESNFDAASRMIRALGGRADITITLCTPVPRALLRARGLEVERVSFAGHVSEHALRQLIEDADLFLLPHGLTGGYSAAEYDTIFPTRAAHYLAAGRAVMAHCPRDSGLSVFLQDRACAVVVSEPSEAKIRQAFEKLCEDAALQKRLAVAGVAAATLFEPGAILKALLEIGHSWPEHKYTETA